MVAKAIFRFVAGVTHLQPQPNLLAVWTPRVVIPKQSDAHGVFRMAEEAKTRLCVRRAVHFVNLKQARLRDVTVELLPTQGCPWRSDRVRMATWLSARRPHGLETPVGVAEMVTAGGKREPEYAANAEHRRCSVVCGENRPCSFGRSLEILSDCIKYYFVHLIPFACEGRPRRPSQSCPPSSPPPPSAALPRSPTRSLPPFPPAPPRGW